MQRVPGEVLGQRQASARQQMAALGVDSLLVTSLPNVFYLTGHEGSAGVVLLTASRALLYVDPRYVEAVTQLQASPAAPPDLEVRIVPASYDQAIVDGLIDLGLTRVGVEAGHLTLGRHRWFVATLAQTAPTVELVATEGLLEDARAVKDAHEVALLRRSCLGLTAVADAGFRAVGAGVAEREVAGAIEQALRAGGYARPAFDTIVGSGPNGALPHYRAGERRLERGDLVVLDFGGVLDGYCSDLTRTVVVGEANAKAREVYAAVLAAQQAGIEAVRPGIPASAVDAAARQELARRGFGEAFTHGTGHGLGIDVHELPRVSRARADSSAPEGLLKPGMVVTIEPGAYLPGWGGVRIEDDVLVTETGYEVLTSVTRELLTL